MIAISRLQGDAAGAGRRIEKQPDVVMCYGWMTCQRHGMVAALIKNPSSLAMLPTSDTIASNKATMVT